MNVTTVNRDIIFNSDIIIIAVKPQQVLDIMLQIQTVYCEFHTAHTTGNHQSVVAPKTLRPVIVSVAAGVTLGDIERKVHLELSLNHSTKTS